MISGLQHELIVLPAAARLHIPGRLRSAGMDVVPSQQPAPLKFKDAGTIYVCREGKGSAEILVMDEASLPPEHRSMVAVLIFPGRGSLADWFCGTTNRALRNKVHETLYAFKSEIPAQPEH